MTQNRCCALVLAVWMLVSCASISLAEEITSVPESGHLNVGSNQAIAIDFGQLGSQGLSLTGNLTNSGTIFAFTSDPNVTVAQFLGQNITNNFGGLITSIMPSGGLAGININPAFLSNRLSLSFTAINNFANYGQITSAANLNVTAGNTITNSNTAVMSAVQNVNISALTSIVNSGLISSQIGNLNAATALLNNQSGILQSLNGSTTIRSIDNQALVIQNALGQINALNSVSIINDLVQSSTQTILQGINLDGGSVTAKNINLVSPTNAVMVDADSLNGTVHIDAGLTSVQVSSGELNIGSAILTNDPVFLNSAGSLVLTIPANGNDLDGTLNSTFFTAGENFIALASGDVTINGSGTIDASNTLSLSRIRIGAGVTFDGGGNITGGSASGGNITMSKINLVNFGGIVNLEARNDNNVAGKGNISVGNVTTIGFDGSAATPNGRTGGTVVMNAASNLTVGNINTTGGAGLAGTNGVKGTDYTGTPAAPGGNHPTSPGIGNPGANGGNGTDGTAGGNGGQAGAIFLSSGGNLNVGEIIANGGTGGIGGTGGDGGNGQQGGRGGNVTFLGTGGSGGNGGFGGAGGLGADGGAGGRGEQVSLTSSSSLTVQSISAAGGDGGLGGRGGEGGDGGDGGFRGSGTIGGGGSGGSGNYGGDGADAGHGGSGGSAAFVRLTSTNNALVTGLINVAGGSGADGGFGGGGGAGGVGQDGGGNLVSGSGGSSGNGGSGGSGSGGGNGGLGGPLTILVSAGGLTSGSLYTYGGEGGLGGDGGSGNNAGAPGSTGTSGFVSGDGGWGGSGGGAGSGGGGGGGGIGGEVSVSTEESVAIAGNVHSYGGEGGNGGNAGAGGSGATGAQGGSNAFGRGGRGGEAGSGGSAGAGGGGGSGADGGTISIKSANSSITINPPEGPLSGITAITNAAFIDGKGANVFLSAGGVQLNVPSSNGFYVGQRIQIINNGRTERVNITNILGNTLFVTPLRNSYLASVTDGKQTVNFDPPRIQVAPSGLVSAGGVGGAGGNGGNGGDGGNGGSTGIGIFVQGQTNGGSINGNSFANGGVSFQIGFFGNIGGAKGGLGGAGGLGGIGGNGGDIILQAPRSTVTVNGNIDASGNNSGLPGDFGLNGRDGTFGATRVFLGLTGGFQATESTSGIFGFGILGAITIDNFSIGGLGTFNNGLGSLAFNNFSLLPGPETLFVNHKNLQGESTFNFQMSLLESLENPFFVSVTHRGQTIRADLGLVPEFMGTALNPFQGVTSNVSFGIGLTPGNSVDLSLGLANSARGNDIIMDVTGFGRGVQPPTPTPTPAPTIFATVGGANVTLPGAVDFPAGPPARGGSVHIQADGAVTIGGTVNAVGGTAVSVAKTSNSILVPVAELGRGGAINIQGKTITVAGASAVVPPGFAKAPVVSGGSITFQTRPNNINFLIKPLIFGNLSWSDTALGLNVANGNGVVLETSPTTLIQNSSGDVDLTNYVAAAGGKLAVDGDLVVLAKGNITAYGITSGSITTTGSANRPTGSIIMAAGDIAATYSYGTKSGDQAWLVLGGGSSTGGDIYLPTVSIGSDSTYLVNLSAHSAPVANQAPFGSILTGAVQTSQGQAIAGNINVYASADIMSRGIIKSDFISLNSAHGNVGNIKSSLKIDAPNVIFNSFAGTYLESTRTVNVLNSQAGVAVINTTDNLNVLGTLTAGAIGLIGKNVLIKNAVSAPGPEGVIFLSTNGTIDDSIGLANLSSRNLVLDSVSGNINLGTLSAADSIILTANGKGASVTANNLNTTFLGIINSSGGVNVATTNASEIVARSSGDVQITSTSAVNLGGTARLPSSGRNFTLTAPGITVSGVLQADQNILLDASASPADFNANRNIVAGNLVDIRSGGSIYQSNSMINATTLSLSALNDIGAVSKPLVTTAKTLNLPSTGRDIFIYNDNESGSTTLTNGFNGRNFVFLEVGNLTVNGSIVVTGDVALAAAGGGSLMLNQSVSGNRVLLQASNTLAGIDRVSFGSIIQTGGTITASNLYLRSGDGGILSTVGGGSLQTNVNGTIDVKSTGAVGINNIGALSELIGRAAQFSITTTSDIALSDLLTTNGNLSVITSSGVLSVKDHSHVMAHNGNLTLRNLSPTGSIVIGAHDNILADLSTGAVIEIAVGAGAAVRTNTVSPSPNIIATTTAGGQVFFGANGIGASPPANLVRAGGANSVVVFDGPAGSISLGGQSIVSANHVAPISSLDLYDPSVAKDIKAQQDAGLIGGSLILNSKGEAIGGTVIIQQPDIYMDLFGLSVPKNVVLIVQNLISPLAVDISSANFTDQVRVNGGLIFTGPMVPGTSINVQSSANPTVISSTNTGIISSQNPLTIKGNGAAVLNIVAAPEINIEMTQGITVTGVLHAPGGDVTLKTGNNGNVVLNTIFAPGGTITIDAHGTGKISATGLIQGTELNLSSGAGDIGSKLNPITTLVGTTVNTTTTGASFVQKITLPPPPQSTPQVETVGNIQTNPYTFNSNIISSSQISNNVLTVDGNLTAFGPAINVENRDSADDSADFGIGAQNLIDTSHSVSIAQTSIHVGAVPSVGNGYFFGQGSAMFAPNRDIEIKTEFGTVHINKGAIVLLVATSKAVSIFNLHDERANDVTMSTNDGRNHSLTPGSHLLITDLNAQTMGKVNPLHSVAHRNIKETKNASTREFATEFSVATLLAEVKAIAGLRNSQDPAEQQAYSKLIKTAVVLGHLLSARGPYSQVP